MTMDWHERYVRQAAWTRDLRSHLFSRAGLETAEALLEVGCGTGAILDDTIRSMPPLNRWGRRVFGVDKDHRTLQQASQHSPHAVCVCADADALPYPAASFDITFCHFFLLWADNPRAALQEMRRVTRSGGHVIAFAEPDYSGRRDWPPPLDRLGRLQREALIDQGADPDIGRGAANLFRSVGLTLIESGQILPESSAEFDEVAVRSEWQVLQEDLRDKISEAEWRRLQALDLNSRRLGERRLHVPTYFVLAQV